MTDTQILQGLKQNDLDCYRALVAKYTNYVVAVICHISDLSRQDTEELSADVFIKLWNMRDTLDIDETKLKAYIARTTRNMTINFLRKQGFETLPIEEDQIKNVTPTPEKEILNNEVRTQLVEAIKTLPSPDKEIFLRRYFYQEKIKDIASQLNLNENTIHTKLSRGKKKLELVLNERGVSL
ncbi:MAG: hypothetical protein ATN35_10645 [Epulopiscium sp. Nele67-Bin004]|nr:MAG: hypothetical protein ATN35_10645 [Epulopiscium sp. Nele67-Bin004]